MSAWGKFLARITVPTGGWDLAFNDGAPQTATIPAGNYATVLHLCAELEAQLQALGGGHATDTVVVSSTGVVTLTIDSIVSITWADTSEGLEEALGLDGTETPAAGVVTANERHAWGWYPGVISYGTTRGEGLAADDGWIVSDDMARVYSGSGVSRLIAPARRHYRRSLRFGLLRTTEVWERLRGPCCFADRWATLPLYWYPDRDDGTVGAYGSQMDPGAPYYHADGDGEFWIVTAAEVPTMTRNQSHPDWYSIDLVLVGQAI